MAFPPAFLIRTFASSGVDGKQRLKPIHSEPALVAEPGARERRPGGGLFGAMAEGAFAFGEAVERPAIVRRAQERRSERCARLLEPAHPEQGSAQRLVHRII